jgi:phage gp36-like protein
VPYAEPSDVRDVLAPDPARPAGTAAELPDETLQRRIATAANAVDAVLAARGHTTPLTTAPPLVKDVVVAVAAFLADLTYRKGKAHASRMDPVVARYDWAQGLLKAWADGTQAIPGEPDLPAAAGDVAVGEPINPPCVDLTGPLVGSTARPLDEYDPDYYRVGQALGGWA